MDRVNPARIQKLRLTEASSYGLPANSAVPRGESVQVGRSRDGILEEVRLLALRNMNHPSRLLGVDSELRISSYTSQCYVMQQSISCQLPWTSQIGERPIPITVLYESPRNSKVIIKRGNTLFWINPSQGRISHQQRSEACYLAPEGLMNIVGGHLSLLEPESGKILQSRPLPWAHNKGHNSLLFINEGRHVLCYEGNRIPGNPTNRSLTIYDTVTHHPVFFRSTLWEPHLLSISRDGTHLAYFKDEKTVEIVNLANSNHKTSQVRLTTENQDQLVLPLYDSAQYNRPNGLQISSDNSALLITYCIDGINYYTVADVALGTGLFPSRIYYDVPFENTPRRPEFFKGDQYVVSLGRKVVSAEGQENDVGDAATLSNDSLFAEEALEQTEGLVPLIGASMGDEASSSTNWRFGLQVVDQRGVPVSLFGEAIIERELEGVNQWVISPDATQFVVSMGEDNDLLYWNLKGKQDKAVLCNGGDILQFSPDSRWLIAVDTQYVVDNNEVFISFIRQGIVEKEKCFDAELSLDEAARARYRLLVAPDSSRVALYEENKGDLVVCEIPTGKVLQAANLGEPCHHMQFSEDGNSLIAHVGKVENGKLGKSRVIFVPAHKQVKR